MQVFDKEGGDFSNDDPDRVEETAAHMPPPPPELTQEHKDEIKICFDKIDRDGDGYLDLHELYMACELLHIKTTPQEVQIASE